MLELDGLAQLDRAFGSAAARSGPVESFHHSVNLRVQGVVFALYRDFPDEQGVRGEEKFQARTTVTPRGPECPPPAAPRSGRRAGTLGARGTPPAYSLKILDSIVDSQ